MARHACVIEDWPLPDADSEETQSLLPGSGDVAIVAAAAGDTKLGAVWTLHHEPPLLIDSCAVALPELTIAVSPEMRGYGVGGALLDELVARCSGKYRALSLNVHKRNPAKRLYERKGFTVIGQGRGALGIAMCKDLSARSLPVQERPTSAKNREGDVDSLKACRPPNCDSRGEARRHHRR
jgi:GNAT superfamily N-acetyltransferase